MNIYESAQDYLERIFMLTKNNQTVRSIDIANDMGITKQSVHRAIKNFKEDGYILVDQNGFITLTEKGLKIAMEMYDRHLTISQFFISLGVPEAIAIKDACKIEHDMSEETFLIIKRIVNKK